MGAASDSDLVDSLEESLSFEDLSETSVADDDDSASCFFLAAASSFSAFIFFASSCFFFRLRMISKIKYDTQDKALVTKVKHP